MEASFRHLLKIKNVIPTFNNSEFSFCNCKFISYTDFLGYFDINLQLWVIKLELRDINKKLWEKELWDINSQLWLNNSQVRLYYADFITCNMSLHSLKKKSQKIQKCKLVSHNYEKSQNCEIKSRNTFFFTGNNLVC